MKKILCLSLIVFIAITAACLLAWINHARVTKGAANSWSQFSLNQTPFAAWKLKESRYAQEKYRHGYDIYIIGKILPLDLNKVVENNSWDLQKSNPSHPQVFALFDKAACYLNLSEQTITRFRKKDIWLVAGTIDEETNLNLLYDPNTDTFLAIIYSGW
jgi:hypothetical protein